MPQQLDTLNKDILFSILLAADDTDLQTLSKVSPALQTASRDKHLRKRIQKRNKAQVAHLLHQTPQRPALRTLVSHTNLFRGVKLHQLDRGEYLYETQRTASSRALLDWFFKCSRVERSLESRPSSSDMVESNLIPSHIVGISPKIAGKLIRLDSLLKRNILGKLLKSRIKAEDIPSKVLPRRDVDGRIAGLVLQIDRLMRSHLLGKRIKMRESVQKVVKLGILKDDPRT
ncbi:MAG: hypothetical protein SGCHY_002977 [Lobulomycetales sp.]